jgi:PAS domain-containing protein
MNPFILYPQIIDNKKGRKTVSRDTIKMQAVQANTQIVIIETDVDGKILTFNKGAENLLGYRKEENGEHSYSRHHSCQKRR